MKKCDKCCEEVKDDDLFCSNYGKDFKSKRVISQKIVTLSVILIVFAIGVILSKDNILYNYYIHKGDNEEVVKISISHYVDALNIKYSDRGIEKIYNKLEGDKNFEENLSYLKEHLKEDDLSNIYANIYENKAKESFDNKNYQDTLRYLKKAEKYNYSIEMFDNYQELMENLK